MTSSSIISALALTVSLSVIGCSGSDATISLDTSESKLTDAAGDALFKVKLDEAPDEGYAADALLVKVTFDKTLTISCTAADTNADGKVGKGEALVCNEGTTNVLDASVTGKEGKVELFDKSGGDEELLAEVEWKP